MVRHRQWYGDREWRDSAQRLATPEDLALIRHVEDPWLRKKLTTFIGLLRSLTTNETELVALSREALQILTGGKPRILPGREKPVSAYRHLLTTAIALGFVDSTHSEARRGSCRVYRVHLPPPMLTETPSNSP